MLMFLTLESGTYSGSSKIESIMMAAVDSRYCIDFVVYQKSRLRVVFEAYEHLVDRGRCCCLMMQMCF